MTAARLAGRQPAHPGAWSRGRSSRKPLRTDANCWGGDHLLTAISTCTGIERQKEANIEPPGQIPRQLEQSSQRRPAYSARKVRERTPRLGSSNGAVSNVPGGAWNRRSVPQSIFNSSTDSKSPETAQESPRMGRKDGLRIRRDGRN